MLKNLGLKNIHIVPRVSELIHGITKTREALVNDVWFDETNCKQGLIHMENYTRKFSHQTQTYTSEPVKSDGHSEASDAFRQFAQVREQVGRTRAISAPLLKSASSWQR